MPAFAPVTLSGLADLTGVEVESILHYHARGLLPEPRRCRGRSGHLAYHDEHVVRLIFMKRAIAMGFDVSAVEELVGLSRGISTCGDVYEVARRQLARRRAERTGLQGVESEFAQLAAKCPRKGSGQDCPILTGLRPRSSDADA